MMRRLWGVFLIGMLVLAGCQPKEEEGKGAPKAAEAQDVSKRVETVKLNAISFVGEATLVGETEADETVTISAELPGRVVASNFEEGATVDAKQWLIRVDVKTDRTRIGLLQENLEQAERDLKRAQDLKTRGLATPSDIERAELAVKNGQYNLRLARQGVSKSTVSTPIKGVVDKEHLKVGEYANPGMPVATVVNYETIVVRAGLPESELRFAQEGKKVKVKILALDIEREGVIRRVGVQANRNSRTFPIEVEVDNGDLGVRAGMRAEVKMPTQSYDNVVAVPRDALIEGVDTRFVFVNKGGKAEKRTIAIGPERGDNVVVTRGLSVGEEVVVVGNRDIADKEVIKVVRSGQCCGAQAALAPAKGEGGKR